MERGFSEVASAEAEESDGSPKRPMVTAEFQKNWLSVEILSYCKGNCGRRVRKRKREGTSRGSKVSLL